MATNNTNIQFYTDTRTVFTTSNGNGKTAIGSADATVQGFEIEYNLGVTGANEAFKISPLGVNYTLGITGATGHINYTTLLPRIAQVGSLLQSVKVPPDATTLQVDKKILLTDGVSSGSIEISGVNTQITASGDLILNPVGSISANGKVLDMSNGQIHKCPLIHSPNNNDIIVEGLGTGDVVLKTGGVDRLDITETGLMTFQGTPSNMTYNNATNNLTATTFTGSATQISVLNQNGSETYYPVFVSGTSNRAPFIDITTGPFTYVPSTGVLTTPSPPICSVSATAVNQLVNFQNFSAITTFSPILLSSGGGAPNYQASSHSLRYVRINNICIIQLELYLASFGSLLDGTLSILLPVANGPGTTASFAVGFVQGLVSGGSATEITATAIESATAISLGIRKLVSDTGTTSLQKSDISSTFRIRLGGTYFVASA